MSVTADSNHTITPANQRLRIAVLRILFVLAALPILLGVPVWHGAALSLVHTLGTLTIIAAVLGRFWAILYIGGRKNATVMQDGPYSLCRHPLYSFSIIGVVGFGLALGSVVLAVALGALAAAVLWLTARREERFLRAAFGPAYDAYAAHVPRLMPRLSNFHTPPRITVDLSVLRRNLADALVFLTAIPLAAAIQAMHAAGYGAAFRLW
ncbi:isoprenylcysteine carboxylmethyltransferase family protein [Paracoccus suum]|uniref:Isoprenylcysteine carboxylmethyltransferase family protein n=1 Tax=Paracoccus suum TaxID=2259340 RepID=A0A344PGY3_9RHOB|nr:isoprenylcysteine carboxylmethyltransferase family protein [Paracoccus suum]AXC48638.1 isoprenylcysteine carboxylmethyltransferase family protein [Paracoccus suum]